MYVADDLLRRFIPAVIIGAAVAVVLSAIPPFYPERLLIGVAFGSTVGLPWLFYRRGDPLRGITWLVTSLAAVSIGGVLFTGGIFEPAYVVLIALLTMAVWFISRRAVVLYVLSFLGLGLLTSHLMKAGVIAPKALPDGNWYAGVLTAILMVVAVTLLTVRSLFRDVLIGLSLVRAERERVADDLTRLIDTANAPIIGIDAHGRVNEWNQTTERLTGFTKLDALGKDLVDEFITDDYKDSVRGVLELALGGQETSNYEFPLFTKQGGRLDVLLNSTTRRDTQGAVTGVIGIGKDVTVLRKQQKRLYHAQKMESVGTLTGRIAHDFNNLLAVIQGNIALVIESIDDSADSADSPDSAEMADNRECLSDAVTAAADGAYLTKQLLTFSSRQALRYERVNFRSIIEAALRKTSLLVQQTFEFSLNIDEVDVMALADRVQFESALINVVNNAQEASDDGDSIFVEAHIKHFGEALAKEHAVQVGSYIIVVVRDNGSGILEGSLSRVVDPFFTTKKMGEGAGLGLSMVHGYANQSGGYLEVTSELGVGTSVTLTLPFDAGSESSPEAEVAVPKRMLPQQPGTVLIVDDEERLLNIAARILGSLGFRVLVSGDAHQALEVLAVHGDEIDIIFSDIMMPGDMTGRHLAAEVIKSYPSIRVLLATGYEQAGPAPEHSRLPQWQVPVLYKPYSKEELTAAVTDLVLKV